MTGTVRDASGAIVAGADVAATNTDTNIVSRTQSGADGGFVIASLRPGAYSITVETTGFQKIVRTGRDGLSCGRWLLAMVGEE